MQYLALHLDWLFTLRFLLCSCSQFFTVSCHRCRLWLTCLQSESVATSVPPEGWVHQPSTTHSGSAYGSWYFLACVLASMFVKGRGVCGINPCFCAFVHRCEDLPYFQKDRLRERESCGITNNVHLKVPVQSKILYMVIAVRDGVFHVWQMFQHPVRYYLLLKQK